MMEIADSWIAYQLDAAVSMFGHAIEGALLERTEVGDARVQKYTLEQLLRDDFRLPTEDDDDATAGIKNVHGIKYDEVG